MSKTRCFLTAFLMGCSLLVGLLSVGFTATPAQAEEPVKVLVLLDVSGSMNGRIASGGTKFGAARRALKEVAGSLPDGTNVGLRVYGSKIAEPQTQNRQACRDSELVLPVGPLNKAKMNAAVKKFKAVGETPIAFSLGKAVEDLGDSGKRVVVLISDGEETCVPDPCPVAKKLAKSGVDLQFNAVGLDVSAKARKQLKCIAEAGNGSYYDANRTDDLTEALNKLTQRALRPFRVSGTNVRGTTEPDQAPTISPGRYVDRFEVGDALNYRIKRTPGSTIAASISTTVPRNGILNQGIWQLELSTMDGTGCANSSADGFSLGATTVISGSVLVGAGVGDTVGGPPSGSCLNNPELVLSVVRRGSGERVLPVELAVVEEPAITNLADLPKPVTNFDEFNGGKKVKTAKPVHRTLGGDSFTNAAQLKSG